MEAQENLERYEDQHINPAYVHDNATDSVYKYNGHYNQKQIPDSHHRSFSTIAHEIDDKESSKAAQSRVGPVCLGATFLFIALVIAGAVVIAVMTVVVNDDVIYPDVLVVGESSTKGEITLSNNTWDSNYENSSSEEYKSLESEFIEEMDNTYRRSTLANVYNQTTVEQFRQGSVIVEFLVHLNGATPSAQQIQARGDTEQLQQEVELATSSDVMSILNTQTDDKLLGELPVGEASFTEVSVTIEVEAGNSENQPPETEPPSVTCPDDITQNTDDESPTAIVTWEEPFAEDNSGVIDRIESQPESGSEFKIGETEVTVLAYDAAGNIGVCTFTVIVIDEELPSVICPSNITENVTQSEATRVVTWLPPEATDNSGEDLYVGTTPVLGHAFPIGVTPVVVTVRDLSGNSVKCTFFVNILDNERPVVTCPADVAVNTDPGQSTGSVTWTSPSATDNSGQPVSLTSDLGPGNYDIGQHVVTYTGEDGSGNTAQCSFNVTVMDNEPPVIMCPSDISNKTQMGELYGYITWTIPPPTDNSGDLVTYETNYQPGEFPIGSYTVNATGTDVYGNTAWCTFMFVVEPLCHPEFCLNKGNCSFSPLDNAYVCQCSEGFLGHNCEFELPDPDACGINRLFPSTRIVGGEIASPGSWPWQILLDYRSYLCGATLITNQWILTAAHCVGDPGMRANLVGIILGEVYLTNTSVSRVNRSVERIVVHPGYQTIVIDNDIALIQLTEPVEFDDFVRPACLPSDSNINEEEYYSKCYTTGWGRTQENGDISMILLQAEVPLINKTVCDQKQKALGLNSITENMICAGIDEKSSCQFNKVKRFPGKTAGKGTISLSSGMPQGDSGGPLVCEEADGRWTLVGITSWGYVCGDPESPSVFVRVSKYLEYIESVIQGNPVLSCEPVNSGCQMNVPYTDTFTTSQSQIEYFVDGLYRYYFQGLDPFVCDIDEFNATMCSFFFKGCDQGIVPCRQYCESVHLPCLQDNYFCTFMPYGPPGEQWCIDGRDYCGEQNIYLSEGSTQVLKNPFFGNYNQANRDCIWLITGPVGYNIVVRVQFLSIDFYTHTLSVGHGRDPERRSSTIAKLFDQTQLVLIEDHEGWIRLETSVDYAYSGFSALLMVADREHGTFPCMENSLVCSKLCLPKDWLCDGIRDCQTGEDEANCTITDYFWDIVLTEDKPNYFLLSPGYPQYPPNLNATWLFTCLEGFVIRVTFLVVETQTCCDIIEVSDDTGQSLLRWSGYMQNEKLSVTSRGNNMLVSFQTNDYAELSGFVADVELLNYTSDDVYDCDERFDCGQGVCIPFSGVCNGDINCNEGVDETCAESIFVSSSYIFNSPNYPSDYPDNFEYTWYFSTDPGSQLLITFNVLSTESRYDYIYVREGSNISAISDLLLRWSGIGPSDELRILSSENLIWVTFDSDGSVAYDGFVATVEVTNMTREELNCSTEFDCDNGVCLPQSKVCDGRRECGNNADETSGRCIVTCGPSDFSCYDGECVDWYQVCDGYPDCYYGEDEFECHDTEYVFVNSSYMFSSPNYPSNYPHNFEYTWYFSTDPGSQLLITFNAIYTESGFDYIYVREGSNFSAISDLLLRWSGSGPYDKLRILSSENLIWVTFDSDGSVAYDGFLATVEVTNMTREELNCGAEFDCDNGVCLPQSKVCDGDRECGNNADETNRNCGGACGPSDFICYDGDCVAPLQVCDEYPDCSEGEDELWCNGTDYFVDVFLTKDEPDYFLLSPGYPRYPPNLNATWSFTCPEGFVIRITFLEMHTQACCDIVEVSDDTGQSLLRWSWYLQNGNLSVTSRRNNLLVSFQTDEFTEYTGFSADVELLNDTSDVYDCGERFDCGQGVCIPYRGVCNDVINCFEGVDETCSEPMFVNSSYIFTSPNYPSNYPTDFEYTWYFSTYPGSRLLITFSAISTEPDYDYIYIREDSNIPAIFDSLLRWSGTGSPNELRILSPGNIILVTFYSDIIIAYNGFVATVEVTNMTREELNCGTEFDCRNGVCLPGNRVCDGKSECGNNADERTLNCTGTCGPSEFSCYDGICIDRFQVCDGYSDCSEGEDELWCNGATEPIFVTSSYIFTSPYYPSEYPINFVYTWYFSTNPGSQLLITFSVISTEFGYDYIYIREDRNISAISDLLLQWSGTGSPNELRILSPENTIWVTFFSDGYIAYNGFVATVEVTNMTREELNCGTEFDCDNGVCLPQSKVCNGRRECGNNADETYGNCTGTCSPLDFSCYDGRCIYGNQTCNGVEDCSFGEDEFLCNGTGICGPSQFRCYDGECVADLEVCDGFLDCSRGEDEFGCHGTGTCGPLEFSCYDGICIPGSWQCDGFSDCSGGEDEFWCNGTGTCHPSDFSCYNGDCVDWFRVCDGIWDCLGGEDEFWCNGTACSFFCNNMTCISSSLLCDGNNDCDEGEDEDIDTCGGDIFLNGDDQVYLMSPNYPNRYPHNFNVSWKISTLGGYRLKMQFISFHTEYYYDYITIGEFDDITYTQLIKKWSGNDRSLQVSTSTHRMRVTFNSDGSDNGHGFKGIVTSSPGNVTSSCPASYFDCGNGACFSMEAGCDTEVNCGNGADAESCSENPNRCDLTQFNCGDMCIANELVCDGKSHCINSEDEDSFCSEVLYIPENTVLNITSPNYPSPYSDNSNETWYFRTDPGVQILVYFLSFFTEESYDVVTIGDGLQVSSHLLLKWSGSDPLVSVLSTSNHLWFNFQSDELYNYDGFEAVVYAVKLASNDSLECEDYQVSCSGSACLPYYAVCDGIMSCGNGEDEENCIDIPTTDEDPTTIFGPSPHEMTTTSQTATLPGPSANPSVLYIPENTVLNVTSPNYPSPYPDNSNETWYFKTDPGVQILVYFLSFYTEESYDFVTIGDGLQVSSHLLLEWSGSNPSVSVLSTSNHLWFNFRSDDLFNYDGFEAVVYAVKLASNDSLECEDYQFSCSGSVCLPSNAICDDVISCGSGQDETNCTGTACPEDFFQCSDGVCFSTLLLCDGTPHCTDGEDEAASLCANETDSSQCTPVPSYCQQYLPYNSTRFPHQFASDITDAEDMFSRLMPYLSCHDNATAFVCAALYPDCQDIGVIVEPCNTTCFEVIQSCEPVYFNGTEELWPFTCFHYGNYYRQAENGYCLAVQYLVSVSGSILMNQTFSEELLDRNSDAYQSLAVQFITECDSLFSSSFVLDNSYLGTKIDGFSAGSVNISFQVFLNQLIDGDAALTATAIHVTMEDAIDFQTHFQSLPLLSETLTTHPANVMDNVPPRVMSCPDNVAVEAGNEELVFVSWEEPLVSDNSGSWILQEFSPSTSLFQVDTVTDVLYVFEDPSGNQARCEFTVAILPPSCDPVYVDLTEGQVVNISTPFYPEDFPREIICYWNFTSPTGLVVLIEFDVFQLGGAELITSVGTLSGFQIPAPLISSTSHSSITFTSTTGQFTYPGFHATVKAVNATYYSDVYCDNGGQVLLQQELFCDGTDHCLDASDERNCECTEEDFICYYSNRCIQSFQVCNEIRDCPLSDDEINCHPNCSAEDITLMSNESTLIQSTNFPGFYFPNMECAWIVTAPENHSIIVRTSFLEIGEEDSITIGRGQNALNTSNTICEIRSNDIRDVAVDERFAWIRFSSGSGEVTTEGFMLEVVALSQRDFEKETFQCYSGQSIIKSEVCDGVNDCPDFADEDECPPCVDVSQTECHPLLPYQQTIFPHPLAVSLDEASSHFSHLSFLTGCHPSINILLCSVLYPDCPHTGPVTRPCRSFCLNVTNSCKTLYEETMNLTWPINCDSYDDNLPVGDNGFCNGGDDDVFNTEICGTRPAAPIRGRIVGGTGASFGDWPWIASLRDDFGGHQCGATLITERWAITAAHCIGHVSSAIFGDLYLSTPSTYHHETTFTTQTHPQYNPYTKEHDIALLELHIPVNFSDYVRPSCLSTLSNETDVYQRCYIAGWGHLMYEASTVPDRLQEALTHLFTAEECRNYISSNYKEDVMLCAGYDEGGIDTCQGDSGGPLVCEGHDGRWHLVGVTSFGFACALPELPGVYTRISQHIDFIKSHVG